MGRIPMIDRIEVPLHRLKNGTRVTIDGESGTMQYDGDLLPE
jgi:phosphohistidine swiveling domain-containing protein